jgi:hypothetical protein
MRAAEVANEARDLIARARSRNVRLLIADGELRMGFKGPRPAELLEELKAHKRVIIAILRGLDLCACCGEPIDERLPTSWGGEPVHRDCGEREFRAEKARGAYSPKFREGASE